MTSNWQERVDHRQPGDKFYRNEKYGITVCRAAPVYYDEKGDLVPNKIWILYRDFPGFREGEFVSAEAAMHAANVNPQSPSAKVVP